MKINKKPVTHCRYCAEPLRHAWQPLDDPNRAGIMLVTCDNKNCRLVGHTFSLPRYYTMDLKEYLS